MVTETVSKTIDTPTSSRWRNALTQETITTSLVSLVVAAAVLLPLFTLTLNSFLVLDDLGFDTEWGLGNYPEIFQDRIIRKAFFNTLLISTGTTLFATVLGVSLAWLNARTNCPYREQLEPFNLIPFFLSPFVGAIAWHNLAAPRVGLLNNLARAVLGLEGHVLNVDTIYGIVWGFSSLP